MLTSKHVIGMYTFTNVSKHVFKMRMCYYVRSSMAARYISWELNWDQTFCELYVWSYSNVHRTMSDN